MCVCGHARQPYARSSRRCSHASDQTEPEVGQGALISRETASFVSAMTGRPGFRCLALAALLAAALLAAAGATGYAARRQLLGPVVAGCALDQRLTVSPFPCLAVDDDGRWGHAVVRPWSARTE